MWTKFWDMHSGGGRKEPYDRIYIEAPEKEACIVFYNRFGHNPNRVTCTCCGEDYSIDEHESLEQATAFHRNCRYDTRTDRYVEDLNEKNYTPLDVYLTSPDILVIRATDITPEDRLGTVPKQGYVWVD